MPRSVAFVIAAVLVLTTTPAFADLPGSFQPMDVFALEFANDPQVSPDGNRVAYVRNGFDVMKDQPRSRIWIVNVDGTDHRPLCDGTGNESSPRWAPDGNRLLYISDAGGRSQLHCTWTDTKRSTKLTDLPSAPAAPTWSPDGKAISYSAFVEEPQPPFIQMPQKPDGAEWAAPPKIIRDSYYRADGKGYLKHGHRQLFVVAADGGATRQVTSGSFDHCVAAPWAPPEPPAWTPDSKSLVICGNRRKDSERDPLNSELYEVTLATGEVKALTARKGPDHAPAVSPDGKQIVYIGYDDKRVAYQQSDLCMMNRDAPGMQVPMATLDHPVSAVRWDRTGNYMYLMHADQGDLKVLQIPVRGGKVEEVAGHIGGTDIGRPYTGGSFSVADNGTVAFTLGSTVRPTDVGVRVAGEKEQRRLTHLNEHLLAHRSLGKLEKLWFASSVDGKKIQGWVVTPPHFDPKKKYPLVLEIHGGPYADYGPTFAVEIQLYAAAGYVVLYINPRGSTSYGESFAQLINGNYPGHDYDDLMSGVDAVIKRGFIDERNLFVTGGSGGGVLTAWIVGKTDRFRAAVSAKPIINWESGALTTDIPGLMAGYWFDGPPWEKPGEYRRRSPLSLVGNVKTPTMLLTGEEDHRTPISESEQFYAALKLRGVETALARFPGASHVIVDRPSRLIAKTACILKWFELYRQK